MAEFRGHPFGPVCVFDDIGQRQAVIDVSNFRHCIWRNLKAQAQTLVFIAVMRPENRVSPSSAETHETVSGAPSFPRVFQRLSLRWVLNVVRKQLEWVI